MTQTIGQKLKNAREEKRLTLEKVFEDIRIRIQYLEALEADDLSIMPSPVQARGYLRNYAQYLELDFNQLLKELRADTPTTDEVIGPAENASSLRPSLQLQDNVTVNSEPQSRTADPVLTQAVEVSTEEVPSPHSSQPSSTPTSDISIDQTPSRPARRKKVDSQPKSLDVAEDKPDSASPPKRRGRKKTEPEPDVIPVVEVTPELIEEPVVSPASVEEETESPVEEAEVESLQAEPQLDINDGLWQTWLHRLGSVLSARGRRPTLVPKESAISELESDSVSMELNDVPEVSQQVQSETENIPSIDWSEIFKEIGIELRQRRELLSLHLEEVERNTHVKAHYLDALEKGAIDKLPSTVQTRGMLSNYATFLDLDVDALLLRFADALQARHRERNPQKPARKPGQPIVSAIPSIRSFIAGDMIFGIGIAVLLVGFSIWGVSRVLMIQSQREVQATAPSISDVLLASPDPSQFTVTPELLPAQIPGATVTIVIPTQNLDVNVQVNLVAVERTDMRVIVDGEETFNGRVVPGTAYPYQAETQIEVLVGNGAAIRTVYNGRDLGLMGTFGQVVNNIYLSEEIITPTTLPSPTITSTVPVTSTTAPTSTATQTSTPVPSNTALP
jgi:cytoskeleton protein RodZ